MVDKDLISSDNYQPLQELRSLLRSDITIGQPETMTFAVGSVKPFEREGVTITINVQNTAPESTTGGNVVFMGVGLRITDGRKRADSMEWPERLTINSSLNENVTLRQKYQRGAWTSHKPFPAITPDEQEHGDVLFPGESIAYELKFPREDLPCLDIKVEGTISRRHLVHVVHEMEPLKQLAKPILIKTFSDIDALNILQLSLAAADKVPKLRSSTTLADIEAFRKSVDGIIIHVDNVMLELNKVYNAALNQELRDFMKQVIGEYITAVKNACNATLEALNSGDAQRMSDAAESLKIQLLACEDIRRKQSELMASYNLNTS